jgi:hypothetical protein
MEKAGAKSPAQQVREIEKLVWDAQGTLDQVERALELLRQRLEGTNGGAPQDEEAPKP